LPLFIDWDNLAISTSADMEAGRCPTWPDRAESTRVRHHGDRQGVRRMVSDQRATQRLPLRCRTLSMPHLPVRAGPSAPTIRSKSLADPCMVADAVASPAPDADDHGFRDRDWRQGHDTGGRLAQLRVGASPSLGRTSWLWFCGRCVTNFVPYRSLVPEASPKPPWHRYAKSGSGQRGRTELLANLLLTLGH